MHLGWFVALGVLGLGSGCGGSDDDEPAKKTFHYAKDDVLRVNQLQCKGTHNSYHVAKEQPIPALAYTHVPLDQQLESQGVRQFELDTHLDVDSGEFVVFHLGLIDELTTCSRLVDCLTALRGWSKKHPAHQPLFVQIEPKDGLPADADAYFATFEQEILSVWPRTSILAPDDVKRDAATLREGVTSGGWPTLGEARGKILFFVDNRDAWSKAYAHGGKDLGGRLMFIDTKAGDDLEAVHVLNDPTKDSQAIAAGLAAGFIVRTRADADNVQPLAGDTSQRDAALASGAQAVSTDYPAPVEGVNYVVEVPGGTPSRCNPVTAPADCLSTDVENPDFL